MNFEFIALCALGLLGAALGGKYRMCRAWITCFMLTVAAYVTVFSAIFTIELLNGVARLGEYTVFTAVLAVFLGSLAAMYAFVHWLYFRAHEEAAIIFLDRFGGLVFGFGGGIVAAGILLFAVGSCPLGDKIPNMQRDRQLIEAEKVLNFVSLSVNAASLQPPSTVRQQARIFEELLLLAEPPAVRLEQTPRE
jgi:hypothetical protein